MIDGRFIVELWEFFKAHSDKKQIDVMAEKYVDILADYGVEDDAFKEGWLVKVEAIGDTEELMDAAEYEEFVKEYESQNSK